MEESRRANAERDGRGTHDVNGETRARTLLVVVDELPARRLVAGALGARYRVLEAEDRDSAIARLGSEPVELVLLDLHLPPWRETPAEGIRLFEWLRAERPEVPVVVVSANDDAAVRERLHRAGARTFLAKPVDGDGLVRTVRGLFGK